MLRRLIFFIAAISLLSSCEKEEKALVLPPATEASHASIETGSNYETQVFFDFETGMPVYSSKVLSWDLAFEASPSGRHVLINGGKEVLVFNTRSQDMQQLTDLPAGLGTATTGWQFDPPSGLPDSTAIGDWFDELGNSKGEVYIVRTAAGENQKMRILAGTDSTYTIEWAPLESAGEPTVVHLTKDDDFNYIYFSFADGTVNPEPPKTTWDVVFTRYRPMVYHNDFQTYVPYPASGVLLNPYKTHGAADSTTPFASIDLEHASMLRYTNRRDIIGYDWKSIDFNAPSPRYTVNRAKNYMIRTRKDQLYKLRFLDYYNSSGVKGSPLFEYVRLQ